MSAKSTGTRKRSIVRRSAFAEIDEPTEARRLTVLGLTRPIPSEKSVTELSETDTLLHQSHDLVAQLREAVGRPRLDL